MLVKWVIGILTSIILAGGGVMYKQTSDRLDRLTEEVVKIQVILGRYAGEHELLMQDHAWFRERVFRR